MAPDDWVARARDLATAFSSRAPRHDREGSFPFENFDDLRDAGFLALTVPRAMGGHEASLTTFPCVQEEFARGDGSTALALNMHLIRFGQERESPIYPPTGGYSLKANPTTLVEIALPRLQLQAMPDT